MTKPVQVALMYDYPAKPKIFLRTLLYATGKRGYVIEGLYLKIKHAGATNTFGFWSYGDRNNLMVTGGLRVTEEGEAHDHHFQQINEQSAFDQGDYEIAVYARIVNRRSAKQLSTFKIVLSEEEATTLRVRRGVLFTLNPETAIYHASFDDIIKKPQRDNYFQV